MANPFDHFGLFLGAVWEHSLTLATGCVITVLVTYIEKHWRKKSFPLKVDVAILLGFVFFACFQAWHDEYKRADAVLHPPVMPPVIVNVPPLPAPQVVVEPQQAPPSASIKAAPPAISFEARKILGVIAQVQVFVTARGNIVHPVFEVICDHPCKFMDGQYFGGATQFESPDTAPTSPSAMIRGWFLIPALMKDGEQVILDVASMDGKSINVEKVKLVAWDKRQRR